MYKSYSMSREKKAWKETYINGGIVSDQKNYE